MPNFTNILVSGNNIGKLHKIITGVIVIAIIGIFYFGYGAIFNKKGGTTYVSSSVTKGTITTSVSGSGQVAASSTINLQFKASGTLVYLPVQNGQNVSAGQLIAQLDTTDAQKSVRDAQSNLESAQIALQKLQGDSSLSVPRNKQDAIDTLNQDYQSGYNTISNVFIDLPTVMTDLQGIIYGNTFYNYQQNIDYYAYGAYNYDNNSLQYKNTLVASYQNAVSEYTKNFGDYKATTRYSDNTAIDSIITETYNTTKDIAQAVKDASNLIQFYKDTLTKNNIKSSSAVDTHISTLTSDAGKVNSDLITLLNSQNTIKSDQDAVSNAGLDLQSQQLSVQRSQNSLSDAKSALSNYYIYAPFSGTIGKISVQKLDNVGSGTSVATIITTQKICTIPLNEVDVSKVQAGQKVMLTFDALPDLTVAGQVATIDPVGTVSQGVVTYNVQISFDTQDTRVKSGMSISAEIITNVKQDVLIVPNSAVKTQGATKYVQVLVNNIPQQKVITTGLVNDTNTEIISGLNEGENVITQTITNGASAAKSATTGSSSSVRIPGLGGFGGGRGN
jgi:HlyD family secretion protein